MMNDEKQKTAILLLTEKAKELGRTPRRADFSPEQACLIKQKLGPWPRALEAAGLKEPPEISSKEKSKQKRERLKLKNKKSNDKVKE